MTDCNAREIYLADETYHRLIEALVNVEPSAWTGTVTDDEIKLVLGEAGGIWPEAIRNITDCNIS